MLGIVSDPVETVLAIEDPEIVPNKAEDTTDTLARPPVYLPATTVARSTKNCPKPILCARTPNKTKWNTTVDTIHSVIPYIPRSGKYILLTNRDQLRPGCFKICTGIYGPRTA